MRVYHLIKGLGRGGAEMLLPEVIRATPEDEATFRVGYFLPWKDHLVSTLDEMGTSVVCFEAKSNGRILARTAQVARDVKRFDADLIHCHLPVSGVVGRLAGKLAGVPVVYTEHNLQERYHPVTAAFNKRTWRLQKRVIACSDGVRASIHEHIGTRVPVQTVLNGVSLTRFQPDPELRATHRQTLGIAPDVPVMGTVAVFGEPKRLDCWLELAASVREALPQARFLLVGDGPLRDQLDAKVDALGLRDAVVMPGLQEDVRPWLAASDVYVMTSAFEGLPIAMLEAMASGLPPVCTAVGGIGQVITSGETGFLADADAWRSMKAPIVELLSDPERRQAMGAAARQRVAEGFSVERMAEALLQVYREVIGG